MGIYRNNKPWYYAKAILRFISPAWIARCGLKRKLKMINRFDVDYIQKRVNYYNKLNHSFSVSNRATAIGAVKIPERSRAYYFDSQEYLRFFDPKFKFDALWGDVNWIPELPALVKSRPIAGNNANAVVLNVDKIRHFLFVKDDMQYEDKKDIMVWRGATEERPHRDYFLRMYQNNPRFDVGKTDRIAVDPELNRPRLSIEEQLSCKFILSIEGNDVATNLKWGMSSNSLCFMIAPKFETWFMEGCLVPNVHYVLLKDDYSDIEEKMDYYSTHIEEAKVIIAHAHEYINQFRNKKREDVISLLVLNNYFKLSKQQ